MKRENLLTITVVLLLLLNLGTLGYLFLGRGHHPPPQGGPRVDKIIIETLGYTEQQQKEFDKLKNEHHRQIVELDEQYKDVMLNYFNLLKSDAPDAQLKDSLEASLSQIQNKKATITFDHFKQLKDLCTPEQKPRFNTLIPELMPIMVPPKPMGPPPPRP